MAVSVLIPTVLRKHTGGKEQVVAQGSTIREVIQNLEQQYEGISRNFFENGNLKPFINVYLNDEDIRFIQELDTPVDSSDTVTILPAIAGG
jgi:molybdopterin synthase sulfur carrier subunit